MLCFTSSLSKATGDSCLASMSHMGGVKGRAEADGEGVVGGEEGDDTDDEEEREGVYGAEGDGGV